MKCSTSNVVKLVAGSYKKFTVTLEDEDTQERIDLTDMASGKIIFMVNGGTNFEKILTMPPASPKLGNIDIELTAVDSAKLNSETVSFEIELIDSGPKTYVYIGANLLQVTERLS